ncbi:MAG: hypothetical protein K0U37_05840 [Gammaproteobacteria bacterium]|nr:hypothetical protein [Gammaproteobacteria bacterium]
MYIHDIETFEEALKTGTLLAHSTLDLSEDGLEEEHLEEEERSQPPIENNLGEILSNHGYPPELTLDFGQRALSDDFMVSLIEGLTSSNASAGLTLCFWGNKSLSFNGIMSLIKLITTQDRQPALTLQISGENIAAYPVLFTAFVDAITYSGCLPWLTIDFDNSHISPEDLTFLVNTLERQSGPMGLWINIGANAPPATRHAIQQACESNMRAADAFLKTQHPADAEARFTPATLELLTVRTEKRLRSIAEGNRYVTDIGTFEQKLQSNVLPVGATLDLRKTHVTENDDLGTLLHRHRYPAHLTIEFESQSLPNAFVASFMNGFTTINGSANLTLCFWGNANLSQEGIHSLIQGLTDQHFQPGLTLCISGENLEAQKLFNAFINAITSPQAPLWLTVDFSHSKIHPTKIHDLRVALEKKEHAPGLFIDIGQNGSPKSRRIIHRLCEQTARAGLESLKTTDQFKEETHSLLVERTNDTLDQMVLENRKHIHATIQEHIDALKLYKLSKSKRIKALLLLQTLLLDPSEKSQTAYELICKWESFREAGEIYTQLELISSINELFSSFRSKTNTETTTQTLITQLKQDYTDMIVHSLDDDASHHVETLSIRTVNSDSERITPV